MKVQILVTSIVAGGVTGVNGQTIEVDDSVGADIVARGMAAIVEGKAPAKVEEVSEPTEKRTVTKATPKKKS